MIRGPESLPPWPREAATPAAQSSRSFSDPGSNLILDFHGDPLSAGLCVFSDGNHHMALEAAVQAFVADNPGVGDVFYTTTPPAPLVDALLGEGLVIGNLTLSRKPQVFIGPAPILDKLIEAGVMTGHAPFAQSRGNVLLVRKGNPKAIGAIGDLLSAPVTLALSNPNSEKASYVVYRDTLLGLARDTGIDTNALSALISGESGSTVFSTTIHHREVPQLLAAGQADVAVIYYHLALRYTRIFPDTFDIVPLGGVPDGERSPENLTTRYHLGLIGDGGTWGERFVSFMRSPRVQVLYEDHGLQRVP